MLDDFLFYVPRVIVVDYFLTNHFLLERSGQRVGKQDNQVLMQIVFFDRFDVDHTTDIVVLKLGKEPIEDFQIFTNFFGVFFMLVNGQNLFA